MSAEIEQIFAGGIFKLAACSWVSRDAKLLAAAIANNDKRLLRINTM
jgi:hypothetical protein